MAGPSAGAGPEGARSTSRVRGAPSPRAVCVGQVASEAGEGTGGQGELLSSGGDGAGAGMMLLCDKTCI